MILAYSVIHYTENVISEYFFNYIVTVTVSLHDAYVHLATARHWWSPWIRYRCRWSPFLVEEVFLFTFCGFQVNPFSPTLFLIVAKMSLPKRSAPYWSNLPFLTFLTFGHPGTQLKTERQSAWMSKIKNGGLDQYGLNTLKCNYFTPLSLKGLTVTFLCIYK